MTTTLLTRLEAGTASDGVLLAEHLKPLRGAAVSEPGNLSYEIFAVHGEPLVFYILETWNTEADARRHIDLVESNGTAASAAPLLSRPLTTLQLNPLGGPS